MGRSIGRSRSGRSVVVHGGTVWTESGKLRADVLVRGETIVALGDSFTGIEDALVIDASGLEVLPGLIDAHVHLDDQVLGAAIADGFTSGSKIAVRNGITTLGAVATQRNGESLVEAVARTVGKAEGASYSDFVLHVTPTVWPWDWPGIEELLGRGHRTVKVHTTDLDAGVRCTWEQLAEVMRRLVPLGGKLLVHCEDEDALSHISPDWVNLKDPANHGCLRPPNVELAAVRTMLELVAETGCPVHVLHVTSPRAAEAVGEARRRLPVTCDTGPSYLLLDDSHLEGRLGHRLICVPPLRSAQLREGLESLAAAGAFDLLASHHCPILQRDKDDWKDDFRTVPPGLPGVGVLLPLAHELLVSRHGGDLDQIVRLLSAGPARMLGLFPTKGCIAAGADADLLILDPAGPARPLQPTLAFCHNPYEGGTTRLCARWVLLRGRVVVQDGALAEAEAPRGQLVTGR